jgi:2-phospho-L-lactate guanylyltransferase
VNTLAVIPVKPLGRALGRLSAVLTRPERRELQAAMLMDLLDACVACPALAGVLVVTGDPAAAELAVGHGAAVLPDHHPPQGMNPAVAVGQVHAAARGYDAVLVLTADLPLVEPEDLAAAVAAAPEGVPRVVIVPSRHGTGTNALLIGPPAAIPTRLGPDSRARHRAEAAAAGAHVAEVVLPWVGLDIDTPEDLTLLLAADRPSRARDACRGMALTSRLEAGIGS